MNQPRPETTAAELLAKLQSLAPEPSMLKLDLEPVMASIQAQTAEHNEKAQDILRRTKDNEANHLRQRQEARNNVLRHYASKGYARRAKELQAEADRNTTFDVPTTIGNIEDKARLDLVQTNLNLITERESGFSRIAVFTTINLAILAIWQAYTSFENPDAGVPNFILISFVLFLLGGGVMAYNMHKGNTEETETVKVRELQAKLESDYRGAVRIAMAIQKVSALFEMLEACGQDVDTFIKSNPDAIVKLDKITQKQNSEAAAASEQLAADLDGPIADLKRSANKLVIERLTGHNRTMQNPADLSELTNTLQAVLTIAKLTFSKEKDRDPKKSNSFSTLEAATFNSLKLALQHLVEQAQACNDIASFEALREFHGPIASLLINNDPDPLAKGPGSIEKMHTAAYEAMIEKLKTFKPAPNNHFTLPENIMGKESDTPNKPTETQKAPEIVTTVASHQS